jgi:hypothetical protein
MTLTLNTTLFVTWGALMIAWAFWLRHGYPLWEAF